MKGVRNIAVTNDMFAELRMHYITIFVLCQMLDPQQEPQVSRRRFRSSAACGRCAFIEAGCQSGANSTNKKKVLEPNKCEEWVWLTFADISRKSSEELFLPIQNLLRQAPQGQIEKLLDVEA